MTKKFALYKRLDQQLVVGIVLKTN